MPTIDPTAVRRIILHQSRRANVGHIGSSLSVVEILCAVYENLRSPSFQDRDRFVLSKGHAALALYATLAESGRLSPQTLDSFCSDNSLLGVHPEAALPGIDFSTGSLGQGLSMACGAALAGRIQNSQRRVYCLLSDAECNEGSVWEAAMFAAHNKLGRLTAIVDVNGQQALGLTRDVLDQSNLAGRWRAFGWNTLEADGHDVAQLRQGLRQIEANPTVILAHTKIGKGVPFMEKGESPKFPTNPVNWHYLPMSDREFELALAALSEAQIA